MLDFAVQSNTGPGAVNVLRALNVTRWGHDVAKCWELHECSHCKKHGHDVNICYEVVGYPNGWQGTKTKACGSRSSTSSRSRGSGKANAMLVSAATSTIPLPSSLISGKLLLGLLVMLRFLLTV